MAYDKLIFMPFDPAYSGFFFTQLEYGSAGTMQKNKATIDHEIQKGRTALAVWYDGNANPAMTAMTGGQIYIRGHGMAGDSVITGAKGGAETVPFNVVVDRLIESGLRKSFVGQIKCYNCHSAEPVDPTMKPENVFNTMKLHGGIPFAQRIANEMYARGYKKCTFFGYHHGIDSMPKDGSDGTHKYARASDGITEKGRASENRDQFIPDKKWKATPPAGKKKNIFQKMFRM